MEITITMSLPDPASLPVPMGRRWIRLRARLTQGEVAHLLGVTRPTVTRWESGTIEPKGASRVLYAAFLRSLIWEPQPGPRGWP